MIIQFLIPFQKFGIRYYIRNKYCLTGEVPSPRENFSLNKINNDILILYGGYECSEDETIEINY